MRRAPANQAAMAFSTVDPVKAGVSAPVVIARDPRAPVPQPGPYPRAVGDRFVCWVCKKERVAAKGTHVWWVQYGNERTSGHLRLVACSAACDKKHPYCVNCGVHGHDRSDGPEICKRYHGGPRCRALPIYKCFAHEIIARHKSDVAQGWTPGSAADTLAKLLIEHEGDFEKVREIISAAYVSPSASDEFGNRLVLLFEQAVRNDPDYGVEYHKDTPEEVIERAKRSVDRYRADMKRTSFRNLDGYMVESEALAALGDETVKSAARLRAINAYGARASTTDAVKVLVPLLEHVDSSIRSTAAWALFSHRTDEVRAAMLARAQVEDVPLLKAYLEQLGEQE